MCNCLTGFVWLCQAIDNRDEAQQLLNDFAKLGILTLLVSYVDAESSKDQVSGIRANGSGLEHSLGDPEG